MPVKHVYCSRCNHTTLVRVEDSNPETPVAKARCRCQRVRELPHIFDPAPEHVVRPVSHLAQDEASLWDGAVEQALEHTAKQECRMYLSGPYKHEFLSPMASFMDILLAELDGRLELSTHTALREYGPTVQDARKIGRDAAEVGGQALLARWTDGD